MNPADPKHPWSRLAAAARRVPDARDTTAPYGFSTRIAARAMTAERPMGSLFERLSWRALGVACLLAFASVALNFSALASPHPEEELATGGDDVVAVLLDLS
ncbi:MAG TPA: hypothetical protein VHO24_19730 [Opitutaceae bacterium]|nr:hypothetical protein [Opitutaceae bacterium]